MMFLLVVYVAHQLLQLAPADGKIPVPSLPEKRAILAALVLNPGRGGLLDLLQQLRLADGAGPSRRNMDMIGCAAHPVSLAITIAANGGQIGVHAWPDFRVQPGMALLRAENDVKDDLAKGLRHTGCYD
jgi:hypothetical protein